MFLNNITDPKFDLNDFTLVPCELWEHSSRRHVEISNIGDLPLISAPMDSVISLRKKSFNKNFHNDLWLYGVTVCYPRAYDLDKSMKDEFISISLEEFRLLKLDYYEFVFKYKKNSKILLDIANGHIQEIYELSKIFKEKLPEKILMIGNIANPETYFKYAEIGVDYCRMSVGSGAACITASNTAIYYPMGSLISECYQIKKANNFQTKIVADGGFKNYSDIIKILAIGADYVMLGSILNKCLESDSYPYLYKRIKITNMTVAEWLFKHKFPMYKKHIGMATKEIQKLWGKKEIKTSEGIVRWNKVEYTLAGWTKNFKDYLRSSMSYMGCNNLQELPEKAKIIFITNNALNRFNK